MFLNLMCRKITIRDTPIERIDDYTFYGVNETLQELEIYNSKLTFFPKAFKVYDMFPVHSYQNTKSKIIIIIDIF